MEEPADRDGAAAAGARARSHGAQLVQVLSDPPRGAGARGLRPDDADRARGGRGARGGARHGAALRGDLQHRRARGAAAVRDPAAARRRGAAAAAVRRASDGAGSVASQDGAALAAPRRLPALPARGQRGQGAGGSRLPARDRAARRDRERALVAARGDGGARLAGSRASGGARGAAPAREPQIVQGAIERVRFSNPDSGFTVALLRPEGEGAGGGPVTIVGVLPSLEEGDWVRCEGRWEESPRFGRQFKVSACLPSTPQTAAGIERYLGSKRVSGVGAELARRIVAHFGADTLRVLESEPERLREVEGIGRKRQQQLIEGWQAHARERAAMVFLHGLGIGSGQAHRIYRCYGERTEAIVRDNPYRLTTEVWGIGFTIADRIARALGIEADAPARLEAALRYVLQESADRGHVCVQRSELVTRTAEKLGLAPEPVERALEAVLERGDLVERQRAVAGGEPQRWIYLPNLEAAERAVAARLVALERAPSGWPSIRIEAAIDWVQQRRRIRLAPSQRRALACVLSEKVSVITGGPGVGKTTVVASLLEIVRAKRIPVRLAAPTGRAAKRMQEATGCEAMTVHRLLKWNPRTRDFEHGREHPIPDCGLLVVDETSMLDIVLTERLLDAVPSAAHLVLVGDPDQLPSVGPGAVLRDIVGSGVVPVARRTEVHRQASGSSIVEAAHAIHRGQMPPWPPLGDPGGFAFVEADTPERALETVVRLVLERLPREFGFDPVRDIQVLAPMHRGGCGVQALNARLAERLGAAAGAAGGSVVRGGRRFAAGTKVIQLRNDYDREVYNGDIGVVAWVDAEAKRLEVDFDGRRVPYTFAQLDEVDLAYAVSVHKSQGSEYPCVVLPLLTQHFVMLRRNLLYTAVTRGKRQVVVVGQRRALQRAVGHGGEELRRNSFLGQRLAEAAGRAGAG
ncbi:MAG: ATP-dependent RecD-like DNA helicase [Planctomycetota bacterium]|nr:MAG: ATP-dependent RecD-like DNA helicase [Planctomycetota bacterium]